MDPDLFDPLDPDFPDPFGVPNVVLELEIPTTSGSADSAPSSSLIVDNLEPVVSPSLPPTDQTFKTPAVPPPAPSPTPSEKGRRTYLPDPIRGTSQHQIKRERNNVAVRKSRAKASMSMQEQEKLNAERRQQSELYREARTILAEKMRRFKENIFERSPAAYAEQQTLCRDLRRINEELKGKGCAVPSLDDET